MQAAFPVKGRDVAALFASMPCLQGVAQAGLAGQGRILAPSVLHAKGAVMAVGDFLLCGGACGPWAVRLLRTALQKERRDWLVYAPGPWAEALESIGGFRPAVRWAFDHHVQPEDDHLRSLLANAPEDVSFQPIEGVWMDCCRREAWSRDFVHEFAGDADYAARGLGVLVMVAGQPVAGASSYVAYPGGIELQVQTREGHEGCGLATLASAALILRAHARGLAATWDAANAASARVAEKLGYHPLGAYTIWEKAVEGK